MGIARFVAAGLALLLSGAARAQLELTAAAQLGYPFLLDRQGYYNSLSPAGVVQAGWRLPQSRLFPSVQLFYSGMQVAVQSPDSGFDDLNTETELLGGFILLNTLLRENERDEWLLSGGIGAAGMSVHDGGVLSGANGPVAFLTSLGSNLKPVATGKIGLRWLHRISYLHPLYLSGEFSCQYLYLVEKEEYRILFPNAVLPATAQGHLLMPAAQIGLSWIFGRGAMPY